MKDKKRFVYSLFLRYFVLLVAALPKLEIFYFIFTPLTVYPVYFILNIFFEASLSKDLIFIGSASSPIQIIGSCIAGAAYYLLLILNLSVPNIKFSKRLKMIGFAFSLFLIINITRIVLLSAIFVLKPTLFDISHKLSWYIGSVVLVLGIWFLETSVFKIKEIPFYTDIKSLLKHTK